MKSFFPFVGAACFSLISFPLYSAYTAEIGTILNKSAVTKTDIESRISLILFLTHQENNPGNREKIRKHARDALLFEMYQIERYIDYISKEKKMSRKKTLGQLDALATKRLENLAKQNNMTLDEFKKALNEQSTKDCVQHTDVLSSFIHQLKGQIGEDYYTNIYVAPNEVDEELLKVKDDALYELREIVLYAISQNEKDRIKKEANEIVDRLNKGVSFQTMAQQYSQSITAKDGGKLGRLTLAQMENPIRCAVSTMKVRDIQIVETPRGIHIIQLDNTLKNQDLREEVVDFKVAFIPFDESMPEDEQYKIQSIIDDLSSSNNPTEFSKKAEGFSLTVQSVTDVPIKTVKPEEFSKTLINSKVGQILKPIRTQNGLEVLCIEKKGIKEYKPLGRDDVKQMLMNKKINEKKREQMVKLRNPKNFIEERS